MNLISRVDRLQYGVCVAVLLVAIVGIIFVPQSSIVGTKESLSQLLELSQNGNVAAQGEISERRKPEPACESCSLLLIGDRVLLMSMGTINAVFREGNVCSSVGSWVADSLGIVDYKKQPVTYTNPIKSTTKTSEGFPKEPTVKDFEERNA